jgi:signal peptidase
MTATVAARMSGVQKSAWRFYLDVLSTIMTVLVVMVACVAVVISVATHLSPRGQYTVFGHPVMTIVSGSMSPVIHTGDLVVDDPVSPAAAAHLRVGQIISVRDTPGSQTIITHRIVGLKTVDGKVSYVTKGDANASPDQVGRPASDVIGVFEYAIPRGGYVLVALHRPLVLGLLVASPLLWFIAGPLFELARRMDQVEDER